MEGKRIVLHGPSLAVEGLLALFEQRGMIIAINGSELWPVLQRANRSGGLDLLIVHTDDLVLPNDADRLTGAQDQKHFEVIVIGDVPLPMSFKDVKVAAVLNKKTATFDRLVEAIETALGEPLAGSRRRRGRPADNMGGTNLSKQQYRVALWIAEGKSNEEIAKALQLRPQSVNNLVSLVRKQLGCKKREEVAAKLAAAQSNQ